MTMRLSRPAAQGRLVAAARMLAGFEQSDLAFAAGVAPSTISNVERGRDVRAATLNAIRDALRHHGVSVTFDTRNGIAWTGISFVNPRATLR